ncbi:MAG: hypothetical protein Q8N23_35145 [Archangium sp.]|nr:hypothetical protein [Archangium sp.]MDP3157961.1 hypothetical protein [Archangium sp.]MDP3574911.1 hypothetical protein [Archangium sp.]
MRAFALTFVITLAASCGRSEEDFDEAGAIDAGTDPLDAGVIIDAGMIIFDAGVFDAGTTGAGTGACSHIVVTGLNAMPSTVSPGEAVTLSWTGQMARGCDLNPGGHHLGPAGQWTVNPTVSTTYTIGCYGTVCMDNLAEWAVASISVTVR